MANFSKKSLFVGGGLTVAGILAASLAFAAYKHSHYHDKHHRGGKAGHHGHMLKLSKLDSNEDEAISLLEFQAPVKMQFETLDSNQDGMISPDEFLARSQARFTKFDADESGLIEASELPKRSKHRKPHNS